MQSMNSFVYTWHTLQSLCAEFGQRNAKSTLCWISVTAAFKKRQRLSFDEVSLLKRDFSRVFAYDNYWITVLLRSQNSIILQIFAALIFSAIK